MNYHYLKQILGLVGIVFILVVAALTIYKPWQSFNQPDVNSNSKLANEVNINLNENINGTAPNSNNSNTNKPVAPVGDNLKGLTASQKILYADLKAAADKRDYVKFANFLKNVYEANLDINVAFAQVESQLYIYVTDTYFKNEDYTKSLEIADVIYKVVPEGWRFRYLKVASLERMGRIALEKGDLAAAQQRAMDILQMMYRPEGANLLADVYIKKIEESLAASNKIQAQSYYTYIKDFEASADRRAKLDELAKKL